MGGGVQKFFVVICCFLGLNFTFVFANSLDTYIVSLQSSLVFDDAQKVTTKQIIQTYCSALQEHPSFAGEDFVYASQQSAFVFLLCSHVHTVSFDEDLWFSSQRFFQWTSSATNKWIFRVSSFSGMGISNPECSTMTNMNGCDLSKVLPPLFTTLLNDYTNLKEASLYGVTDVSSDKETIVGLVNGFAAQYFTPGTVVCGDGSRYPKTCRVMQNYLRSAVSTFANVKLFYPWVLANWADDLVWSCSLGRDDYALIPCGLFADTRDSLQWFTALLYNEQFYYRLFLNYYTLVITANPQIVSSSPAEISRDLFKKKTRLTTESIRSQKAISSSIRSLRDIYAAFPLHIWFMMYQEDIVSFGKRLASLAEPLYTLYDKLRNVQQP